MKRFILLNAPKGVGKDVAKDYVIKELAKEGITLVHSECKDRLHELTRIVFNIPEKEYWDRYNSRETKELPWDKLRVNISDLMFDFLCDETDIEDSQIIKKEENSWIIDLSIRQAMIYVSELMIKPTFGLQYFSEYRLMDLPDNTIAIDGSCGFSEELDHLIKNVGSENVLLIQIWREGFTFEGDSRSYVYSKELYEKNNIVAVMNQEGKELEFKEKIKSIVKEFINKTEVSK